MKDEEFTKEISLDDLPNPDGYFPEDLNETKKTKNLKKKMAEIKERIKAEEFQEKVNNNNLLRGNGKIMVNEGSHRFWKGFAITCFSFMVIVVILFFWTDLLDGFVSPNFFNEVDNEYNFTIQNPVNVTTNVNDENKYYNNFTIYNNIIVSNGS